MDNKKRAEWAGISFQDHWWYYPDGLARRQKPNFKSLDACFKWLEPVCFRKFGSHATRMMLVHWVTAIVLGEEPAPALCAAIDKLIEEA